MTLQIPPDLEARLREYASATGQSPDEVVIRALEATLSTPAPPKSYEEWSKEFHAWLASHKPFPVIADDSRDSIYPDDEP